jgi:hypothetical protein
VSEFREVQAASLDAYNEGRYEDLLQLTEERAPLFPDRAATIVFWKACALARLGRPEEAVTTLDRGLAEGLWWSREFLLEDEDLELLAGRLDFQDFVTRSAEMADAAPPDPTAPLVRGVGERGSLGAIHGAGDNPEDSALAWHAAPELGMQLIVARSPKRFAPDIFCWEKATFGKDLRLTLEATNAATPVVLGGFSQGASLSLVAALEGDLGVAGVIAVCPTIRPSSKRIPNAQEIEAAVAAGNKELRAFFLIGGRDPLGAAGLEAAQAMEAAGYAVHIESREELGHGFPEDFDSLLPRALDFVLG